MSICTFELFYNRLLDFELACGLDCDRCWPIKYLKCRPRGVKFISWARWRCVERAGEFFLAQRLQSNSVCSISQKLLLPLHLRRNASGIKSTVARQLLLRIS